MKTTKNIHQVYFNSFVGTWKRLSIKGSPASGYIKFNEDCTFEQEGVAFNPIEGTVNGDVDEISVDDDGHGHDGIRRKGYGDNLGSIKGTAVLTKESGSQKWSYRIGEGRDIGRKNYDKMLELRRNNQRVIYVGNLPLSEEQRKKPSKKK